MPPATGVSLHRRTGRRTIDRSSTATGSSARTRSPRRHAHARRAQRPAPDHHRSGPQRHHVALAQRVLTSPERPPYFVPRLPPRLRPPCQQTRRCEGVQPLPSSPPLRSGSRRRPRHRRSTTWLRACIEQRGKRPRAPRGEPMTTPEFDVSTDVYGPESDIWVADTDADALSAFEWSWTGGGQVIVNAYLGDLSRRGRADRRRWHGSPAHRSQPRRLRRLPHRPLQHPRSDRGADRAVGSRAASTSTKRCASGSREPAFAAWCPVSGHCDQTRGTPCASCAGLPDLPLRSG